MVTESFTWDFKSQGFGMDYVWKEKQTSLVDLLPKSENLFNL